MKTQEVAMKIFDLYNSFDGAMKTNLQTKKKIIIILMGCILLSYVTIINS